LKPRLPTEPALVGRDSEIEQLLRHLDSASNGKGTTVFVYGEAGVGKTRLINEFLAHAKKMGAEVLSGWCLSEAAIPYFPFTEAFNTYMSVTIDAKAKSTMTKQLGIIGWLKGAGLTKEPQELFSTPEIERDKTFEAVTRVFVQLSAQKPLVLFLDDLQWADHLSLALVHYLSRKCRSSRLLIIGAYRPEETVPTEEGRIHPLEETMFSMSREDLLIKMELKSLKRNDLSELVRSIFHTSTNEAFVEKLYKETEGNPLFVIETLNLLVDEGFLSEKEGQWMLTAPAEKMGIPSKIHEVIIRRITRLGREERRLLDLAAVCGHSFNPGIMSKIIASDVADVLQTLVEIEHRHMLIRPEDSAFEFTHHKIREVIYENLPSELRRVYHLKTANCLEEVLAEKTSDTCIADIALHYVEGGAPEKAFEYLLKLGEKAVNIFANMQAIDYLDKALKATQRNMSLATNQNLAKIYKLRGQAWVFQDKAKARRDFDLMLQNAENVGNISMIAEAHYWLGANSEPHLGEFDEAMQHLTTAVEMARNTGNKILEARSSGLAGAYLMLGEAPDTMDKGHMWLEESYAICKEIGDKVTETENLMMHGLYYNWKGQFDRAKESLKKSIILAEEIGSIPHIANTLRVLSIVLAGNGEYNEAISTAQRNLQLSRDYGITYYVCVSLNTLGWIYHDLSNIELAMKYNNEGIEFARAHQDSRPGGAVPSSLLNLAMDYLYKNDYENAEKYFKEVINAYDQHRVGWWRIQTRLLLGRGEISFAKGDCTQALKFAEDSLAISRKADAKKYIAKGLKLKSEILAKIGNPEEAIELMQNALKTAQEVGNPPLLWQIHYSLGLLLEKQGNLQKANEHYTEAVAHIEETASKLKDASLKDTLLTVPQTKAIRDAYARTKRTP
jgi:tetratricopeptide (TPR) repeat protein